MAMNEDFTAFFSTAEFADQATLDGVPVTGILESGYEDATLEGFGVAGSSPRFTLPASCLPVRPEGLSLVVATGPGAGTYRVGRAMPDGTGMVTLRLIA
jgi:hypothetical protein